MPIDTSTIEGFDSMTADEKVTALLGLDIPEKVDLSNHIEKSKYDKVASELAEAKKALKSKMSEDEVAKAQADADRKELEERYTELLRKSTIAEHTAKYLAMPGYDEKLARDAAEALFDGDTEKMFEVQKKANEAYEKAVKADLMKRNPTPEGSGGAEPEDVAQGRKIGKEKAAALNAVNVLERFKL